MRAFRRIVDVASTSTEANRAISSIKDQKLGRLWDRMAEMEKSVKQLSEGQPRVASLAPHEDEATPTP